MPELSPPGRGALRPGAMTVAMRAADPDPSRAPWARVAIVRRRAIVAQRWVRPGESLTWGRSEQADVVVASAPHDCAALLVADGDAHALVLDAALGGALDGRLAVRGATLRLADEARRGARRMVLDRGARALVRLGEADVLIEITPRPAAPRRAPVPASLGRALGVDPRFTAIAAASLMVHAVFVTALSEHDWPAVSFREQLRRDAMVVFVEPEPPPESPREDALPADDETPREESAPTELAEAPAPGPTSAPRRGHPSAPSAPTAADLTAIGDAIQHAVDLRIGALVAEGGALDDLMREGAMPASQADVMGQVRAEEHASLGPRAGAGHVPIRDGARGIEALDGCEGCALDVRRTGEAREGDRAPAERRITAVVPEHEMICELPSPDFDVRVLARALRGRMGAVRACYEQALREDPTLAGRLDLELTVERAGNVSGVHVRPGSIGGGAFHQCVERSVGSLRLALGPEDGAVDVSFPIVLSPQR